MKIVVQELPSHSHLANICLDRTQRFEIPRGVIRSSLRNHLDTNRFEFIFVGIIGNRNVKVIVGIATQSAVDRFPFVRMWSSDEETGHLNNVALADLSVACQ